MSEKNFVIPMSGKLINLEQVPDENFSQKLLGDGFAIQLEGEVVVSPFSGVIIAALPTGHAYIIRQENGIEALIHIGLDSADKPEAFRTQVNKYDEVKQGDVLVYVDKSKLSAAPEKLISPVVFNPNVQIMLHKVGEQVQVGDDTAVSIA